MNGSGAPEARFYKREGGDARCELCPHCCLIPDGQTGLCGARRNAGGTLYAESYGRASSLALDPIEKKPLHHFRPGSRILSMGSYGCNMACSFCQNSSISQARPETEFVSPERLTDIAASVPGNLGLAFTYNEPLIGAEYLLDAAPLLKQSGMKVVLVSNGMICEEPLEALLPFIDAINIDLKAFTPSFYHRMGGDLETVKRSIARCAESCHTEVTTLIIPGENDGDGETEALSRWLASISRDIPLHLSRFFPRYEMTEKPPTPVSTLARLAEIAGRSLTYVHVGNV
ncbi:MAG: AmmeMemoRadiSam system radical SAM enzyme [Clostridiales Family XIII bacterium]|jgi:pyruvate formate lyase activating enzyme|nr:AmmeMemoRadiSam system radical SAM enzyme [Clostridiales Family XIII bacterium]